MHRKVGVQAWVGLTAVVMLLIFSSVAFAVPSADFIPFGVGTTDARLPANDDASSAAITLGTPFIFFGTAKSTLYVNNNGNITFDGPLGDFTPFVFPSEQEIVAAYFADVDTSGSTDVGGDGIDDVYFSERADTANLAAISAIISAAFGGAFSATSAFVATWDHVGYYSSHTDLLNTFQLILATDGVNSFVIFQYLDDGMTWETGDASGGTGGFGGMPAAAGFDAGNGTDFFTINGSFAAGIANLLEAGSNIGVPGRFVFQVNAGIRPDPFPPSISQVAAAGRITGLVTDSEDVNANGVLDAGEDANGNGQLDARTEDLNGNGTLDAGEDANGNGILDADTGVFSVALSAEAHNLQIEATFTPGALSVAFTIGKIDPTASCSGSIRVADGAANFQAQAVPLCRSLVGDIDGDGDRDADDARLILEVLAGLNPPEASNFAIAGDVNADDLINNLDSVLILGIAAGQIAPPPDNSRLTVIDNGDGTVTVAGAAGTVPPDSTVNLTNTTGSDAAVSATAASDGSFRGTLAATSGNKLVIHINDDPVGTAVTVGDTFPFILDVSRLDDTTQRIQ